MAAKPLLTVTIQDISEIARVAFEIEETRRRRAAERIYGLDAIAAECGVNRKTIKGWVEAHGFPLDQDPRGYSVQRWNLERWFEARRECIEYAKTKTR